MNDPAQLAQMIVANTLAAGAQTHGSEDWRSEPVDKHLDKAIRHVATFRLIRDRHQKPDGEDHLHKALTRVAMAIAIDSTQTNIQPEPASSDAQALLWIMAAIVLLIFSLDLAHGYGIVWPGF